MSFVSGSCFAMEKVFYAMRSLDQKATENISKNANKINIIIAQSYHVDGKGVVTGDFNPDLITLGEQKGIKLMAMITNSRFDSKVAHQFLSDKDAQQKALKSLLELCQKTKIYGVQFDFEMIALADRDALTHFYQQSAEVFHKHGFIVSFAIAPVLMTKDFPSEYYKRLYEVWQGAYDLNKLGSVADFVTVMTYDQHGEGTTPGPIASIIWDEQVLKFILKYIPANKVSLGIPTYSGFWYLSKNNVTRKISIRYEPFGHEKLNYILEKYHPVVVWSDADKVNYAFYQQNWMNKFVFIENAKSFKAKVALAKKYHLRGISVFRLGLEDPGIWSLL